MTPGVDHHGSPNFGKTPHSAATKMLNTQGRDIIASLPGDMAALDSIGTGEGLPIWERMQSSSASAGSTCAT